MLLLYKKVYNFLYNFVYKKLYNGLVLQFINLTSIIVIVVKTLTKGTMSLNNAQKWALFFFITSIIIVGIKEKNLLTKGVVDMNKLHEFVLLSTDLFVDNRKMSSLSKKTNRE